MSRKEGVIHLGRSKSPTRALRDGVSSRHNRVQSSATSRVKEPLQETILNQSMHVSSQQTYIKTQQVNFSQTHPGFFPPPPQSAQQTVIIKENVKSPQRRCIVQQSPSKRVIVSRQIHTTTQNSPCKVRQSGQPTQKQAQLQRKVKVLQSRIQQLHQQKQNIVVKAHEQNKKLSHENNILQFRLADLQKIKNQQISGLRQQIHNLRSLGQRSEQVQKTQKPIILRNTFGKQDHQVIQPSPKSQSGLKNGAYVDDEDDKLSINNHTYKKDETTQQIPKVMKNSQIQLQCRELMNKVKQLETQNNSLRNELNEMKQTILNTTYAIQENNKKIVANYETKISNLHGEIESCQEQIGQTLKLKQNLAFSQNQTQEYVSLLCKKSQQLNKLEQMLQFTRNQCQQYVSQLCKRSQQVNRLQSQWADTKKALETKDKLATSQEQQLKAARQSIEYNRLQNEEYITQLLSKNQELTRQSQLYSVKLHELDALQTKYQQIESRLEHSQSNIKQLEAQLSSKQAALQQPCQKCKQLIKALVKLNCKPFAKTM